MLRVTVIICGILLGFLLAAILVASNQDNVLNGLRYVLAEPWGIVTLLDLGIGLMFVGAWIAVLEPRPLCAALWIVALLFLGNAVTLAFILWRTRQADRFVDLFLPSRRSA
jgi:hypothetical protein